MDFSSELIEIANRRNKKDRLILKDFFSEELKDNYNAIYRTREELMKFFKPTLLEKGFLFEEDVLNNRKEKSQYYFVLER